jgi:hypothetical protein
MMCIVVYSGSGPNFSLYAAKMNPASDDDSVMDMIKMSNLLFPNDTPTTTNATPNNANDRCTSQRHNMQHQLVDAHVYTTQHTLISTSQV